MSETQAIEEISVSVLDPLEDTHPDQIEELSVSALILLEDDAPVGVDARAKDSAPATGATDDDDPEIVIECEEEIDVSVLEGDGHDCASSSAVSPSVASGEARPAVEPRPSEPRPFSQEPFEPVTLPKNPAVLCGITDYPDGDDAVTRPRAFRPLLSPPPVRLCDLPIPLTRPRSACRAADAVASDKSPSEPPRKRLSSLPPIAPLPKAPLRPTLPPPKPPPRLDQPIALPPLPLPFVAIPASSRSAPTVPIVPRRSMPAVDSRLPSTIPPRRPGPSRTELTVPAESRRRAPLPAPWPSFALLQPRRHVTGEAGEVDARPSAPPVESHVVHVADRNRWMRVVPVAAGALVGVAIFLLALLVGETRARFTAQSADDSLVVTVAGPGGRPISDPQIFVDGARRCEASPCRVPELPSGLHFVAAQSPGYAPAAARVVRVERGSPAIVHFDLTPESRSQGPRAPRSEEPSSIPPGMSPEGVASPQPTRLDSVAPQAPATAIAAVAHLNLSSIPISAVVVDGRPLGQTPKVGVPVQPGTRQIVFVHPEHGRLARSVQLSSGENQTIAVRF